MQHEGDQRGAANAAPRSSPLELVEAAVAGDDLQSLARSAAATLGCTVAIVLPALGLSALWPSASGHPETLDAVGVYAAALAAGRRRHAPPELTEVVPVRLGTDVIGVVAAIARADANPADAAWLEATAAAAAVAALMRAGAGSDAHGARRAFLQMLELHSGPDTETLLGHARRLGYDFAHGAVALSAQLSCDHRLELATDDEQALVADVGGERLLGIAPLDRDGSSARLEQLLMRLREHELPYVTSTPRRTADQIREALREAAVLLELALDPAAFYRAHENTYRLLVGVLLQAPDELAQLRDSTIAELEHYDGSHDTELLVTLETFLQYHGSTTDTAEAMRLHRHTVGYRLARVHEVSGLSPYESEGRERLSLGLKANRIFLAESRRAGRSRPA